MRALPIALFLMSAGQVAAQDFTDLGNVASGTQFDALADAEGRIHLLARRYRQLSVDGTELLQEDQGAAQPGGPFGFPPALALGADGSVHTVTRVGGSVSTGHRLRYRRRNADGFWDRDYEFGAVTPRNYAVGVAVLDGLVTLTSSELESGVWGPIRLWSAEESATSLGSLDDLWRADDGTRLRASASRIFFVAGRPDPNGRATVLSAPGGEALLGARRETHNQGSGRRGAPDLYVDQRGRAHVIYGTDQEVWYSRYEADGRRMAGGDRRVAGALGEWRLNIGMGAVAGEGDDVVALLLRPGGEGGEDSEVVWSRSTDGGSAWTAPRSLGVRSDGTEGRVRPRVLFVDAHVIAFVATGGGVRMFALEVDPDSDGDGFRASVDCNDRDGSVNPGAPENCSDAIDNNCDGATDFDDVECAVMDAGAPDMGASDGGLQDLGTPDATSDGGVADMQGQVGDSATDSGPRAPLSGGCRAGGAPKGVCVALLLVCLMRRRWRSASPQPRAP